MDSDSSSKMLSDIDLKILLIECNPDNLFVKFQGKYSSECEFDYHILQNEIQLVPKVNADIGIGEFCLVQDKPFGAWQRGKILDKTMEKIEIVLIDQGNTVHVNSSQIASACGELFALPPKIVNGIFSNILPVGENWMPKSINYFTSLVGLQIKGHGHRVLPNEAVILEVPTIVRYAVELNLAKYIDSKTFCLLTDILHKSPISYHCKQMPDIRNQKTLHLTSSHSLNNDLHCFQKILDHLRPYLPAGAMEKVTVSAAISLNKFYCHIFSWKQELSKLSAAMFSYYEIIKTKQNSILDNFGVLCAAKRKDGLWHRGLIQKLLSGEEVQIWFLDIGSSERVSTSYVQKLQPEFLSLPMMAIPCSFINMNDNVDYARSQLMHLKEGLVGQFIIAKFKEFCIEKNLFFVELYNKDYEHEGNCYLTNHCVPVFSPNISRNICKATGPNKQEKESVLSEDANMTEKAAGETYKTVEMDMDSVHVGYVEYVLNPSNFWIRTDEFQNEFSAMMGNIAKIYNPCEVTERVLNNPRPGDLCCALYAKDGHYYRAVVTDVFDLMADVYFLDFGNTETIPFCYIKILLPELQELPALAMCCSLANVYPLEDVWVKTANDFFKKIVSGKALLFHVLAKGKRKHVVDVRCSENSDISNIVSMMVEAGYAEYWKVDLNQIPVVSKTGPAVKKKNAKRLEGSKQNNYFKLCSQLLKLETNVANVSVWKIQKSQNEKSTSTQLSNTVVAEVLPIHFKQYMFNPGVVVDVRCSQVNSPAEFWCQLPSKAADLEQLTEDIQSYYFSCTDVYKTGQLACIVKCACDGKFYRANVKNCVSEKEIDVVFVDYGNVERVSFSDLREIKPQFLMLEGQAFRCSLNSFITLVRPHLSWTSEACRDFKSFVDSSVSENIKCTVHAQFSSKDFFNAVSLETRFTTASQFLLQRGHAAYSNALVPLIKLHTFLYSDFNIKAGSLEQVCITHIYNIGKFYCQLARNFEAIEVLMSKVSKIGAEVKQTNHTRENVLCIVKYFEDGNYYRAFTPPSSSSTASHVAFFVDYGNFQMVRRDDLLPIPAEAVDILCEPMHAIQCNLSGLKDAVLTPDVKQWLEDNCLGKQFNAVVIAKESDGQLAVELYNEKFNVNEQIKNLLGMHSRSGDSKLAIKTSSLQSPQMQFERVTTLDMDILRKHMKEMTLEDSNRESQSHGQIKKDTTNTDLVHNTVVNPFNDTHTASLTCIKCSDLPNIYIEPGTKDTAYVSHINSPCDFYIQLAKNENKIVQLANELNENSMVFQTLSDKDCIKGILVAAKYPDDMAFYRAEVRDVKEDKSFKVEFIDYGNSATVTSLFRLPDKFLSIPKLSVHVSLSGIKSLTADICSEDLISFFSQKVEGEPLDCTFLCNHETQWEVSLTSKDQCIAQALQDLMENKQDSISCSKLLEHQSPLTVLGTSTDVGIQQVHKTEKAIKEIQNPDLKPSQIEKVRNIYFADCGRFFVTLAGSSLASDLSKMIASSVTQANRLAMKNITKGMMCLAKSSEMETWLRASVEEIFLDKMKMLVFYVDYGAQEIISMHNAKVVSSDMLLIPKQAVACRWAWSQKIEDSAFKNVLSSLMDKDVQILFLKFLDPCHTWKVEVLINGSLLMEYFTATNLQVEDRQEICHKKQTNNVFSAVSCIPVTALRILTIYEGFATAAKDPFDFCLQLEDSLDQMNRLLQLLDEVSVELLPLPQEALRPGAVCLVNCFTENEWCRSKISEMTNDSILFYLIDYGVYKSIPCSDVAKLKCIPESLVSLPAITYRCSLHGVIPTDVESWSTDAVTYFIDFINRFHLLFQPVNNLPDDRLEVNIYGQGSLAQNLISKGFAKYSGKIRNVNTETFVTNELLKSHTVTNLHLLDVEREIKQECSSQHNCDSCKQTKNSKAHHKISVQRLDQTLKNRCF